MNNIRILVVEDEAIVALDIRRQLAELGYEPAGHTMQGEEAVEMAGRLHPNLVLMDVKLAGKMDGITAAREIRERFSIPVVFLTAYAGDETLLRAKRAEPYGYIIKPFEERDLRTVIEMALYKHQSEKRLKESYTALNTIIQSSMDGFYFVDVQGHFIDVNKAYCEMTGYSREELLQMSLFDLVDASFRPELRKHVADILQNGSRRVERLQRRKDGTMVSFEISGNLVPGITPRLFGFARDITERKRLEEQLRQKQKIEAVGQLAGGVAHDFNNILAVILMQLGLLQEEPGLSDTVRNSLMELNTEAQRAAALTRQLLAFSRRQIIQIKPVELDVLVCNLLKMLRRLLGENITLNWKCQTPLPTLDADPGLIEQVVINLCVNARDAMPEGGQITISAESVLLDKAETEMHPDRRRGSFVRLNVADTGCGMDEQTLKRIFEPFFTTKDIGRGTGLGLSTVLGIVKQHGGWIEVESAAGKGSVFHVFLPLGNNAKNTETNDVSPAVIQGKGETILLVEDELGVRSLVRRTLERSGYQILEAGNGPEALALWQQHQTNIDLLFTDVVMPQGMNGYQLAETMRKEKPGLKVVLTTGYSDKLLELNKHGDCPCFILPKPYTPAALLTAICDSMGKP